MKKTAVRLFALLLCGILLLPLLFACGGKADPLAKSGIRSVTLEKKEKLHVQVSLNHSTLEKGKGQKLCLYELLPGEEIDAIAGKEPLAEKKPSASVTFKIPFAEGASNRLFSRFAVAFSDGTLVGSPAWVSQPYTADPSPEPLTLPTWTGAQKGLLIDDAEDAWRLGTSRALLTLTFSELLSGSDVYLFSGKSYSYSSAVLDQLADQVNKAAETGMTVTLEWSLDAMLSPDRFPALFSLVFSKIGHKLGALHLALPSGCLPAEAATLMHYARLALRSHNPSADLHINYRGETVAQTTDFYQAFSKEMVATGFSDWSLALTPTGTDAPWEQAGDKLTVSAIPDLVKLFQSGSFLSSKPRRIDVTGLRFSAKDPEEQTAKLLYSHHLLASAGVHGIYYGAHTDPLYGLYDRSGAPTLAAQGFSQMDGALSRELTELCNRISNNAFASLSRRDSFVSLTGSSAKGNDGEDYSLLFDFSKEDPLNFTAVGGSSLPICQTSSAIGAPVLFTWLMAGSEKGEGVRKILPDGASLAGAFSVSLRILLQNTEVETSQVTLTLDGAGKKGEHIRFVANADVQNGAWQDLIFYIGSFTAAIDPSKPCVMTLTASSDAPDGTEYPLWLDSVYVRRPEEPKSTGFYALIVLLCVGAGFLLCLCIYLVILILRRRRTGRDRRIK